MARRNQWGHGAASFREAMPIARSSENGQAPVKGT